MIKLEEKIKVLEWVLCEVRGSIRQDLVSIADDWLEELKEVQVVRRDSKSILGIL